jgi:hypothetical protein
MRRLERHFAESTIGCARLGDVRTHRSTMARAQCHHGHQPQHIVDRETEHEADSHSHGAIVLELLLNAAVRGNSFLRITSIIRLKGTPGIGIWPFGVPITFW